MHENQRRWLADVKRAYPWYFAKGSLVLEIGSLDWNGTVREFFDPSSYIGVDRKDGPGVDRVDVNAAIDLGTEVFDVLVCLSVFEHDVAWRETLRRGLGALRVGGLGIVSFGAEGNLPHLEEEIGWAPVPHQEFMAEVGRLGATAVDGFFEEERYGKECAGCYNALLRKRLRNGLVRTT